MLNIKPQKFWFAVLALLVLVFIAIPALENTEDSSISSNNTVVEDQTTTTTQNKESIKVFAKNSSEELIPAQEDTNLKISIYGLDAAQKSVLLSESIQNVDEKGSFQPPPVDQDQYYTIEAMEGDLTTSQNNLKSKDIVSDTPEPTTSALEQRQFLFALPEGKYKPEEIVQKGSQTQTFYEDSNKTTYTIFNPENKEDKQLLVLGPDKREAQEGTVSTAVVDARKTVAVVARAKEDLDELDPRSLLKAESLITPEDENKIKGEQLAQIVRPSIPRETVGIPRYTPRPVISQPVVPSPIVPSPVIPSPRIGPSLIPTGQPSRAPSVEPSGMRPSGYPEWTRSAVPSRSPGASVPPRASPSPAPSSGGGGGPLGAGECGSWTERDPSWPYPITRSKQCGSGMVCCSVGSTLEAGGILRSRCETPDSCCKKSVKHAINFNIVNRYANRSCANLGIRELNGNGLTDEFACCNNTSAQRSSEGSFSCVPFYKGAIPNVGVDNGNRVWGQHGDSKSCLPPICDPSLQNRLLHSGSGNDDENYLKEEYMRSAKACCRTQCTGDDSKDFSWVGFGGGSPCKFSDESKLNGNKKPYCLPKCDSSIENQEMDGQFCCATSCRLNSNNNNSSYFNGAMSSASSTSNNSGGSYDWVDEGEGADCPNNPKPTPSPSPKLERVVLSEAKMRERISSQIPNGHPCNLVGADARYSFPRSLVAAAGVKTHSKVGSTDTDKCPNGQCVSSKYSQLTFRNLELQNYRDGTKIYFAPLIYKGAEEEYDENGLSLEDREVFVGWQMFRSKKIVEKFDESKPFYRNLRFVDRNNAQARLHSGDISPYIEMGRVDTMNSSRIEKQVHYEQCFKSQVLDYRATLSNREDIQYFGGGNRRVVYVENDTPVYFGYLYTYNQKFEDIMKDLNDTYDSVLFLANVTPIVGTTFSAFDCIKKPDLSCMAGVGLSVVGDTLFIITFGESALLKATYAGAAKKVGYGVFAAEYGLMAYKLASKDLTNDNIKDSLARVINPTLELGVLAASKGRIKFRSIRDKIKPLPCVVATSTLITGDRPTENFTCVNQVNYIPEHVATGQAFGEDYSNTVANNPGIYSDFGEMMVYNYTSKGPEEIVLERGIWPDKYKQPLNIVDHLRTPGGGNKYMTYSTLADNTFQARVSDSIPDENNLAKEKIDELKNTYSLVSSVSVPSIPPECKNLIRRTFQYRSKTAGFTVRTTDTALGFGSPMKAAISYRLIEIEQNWKWEQISPGVWKLDLNNTDEQVRYSDWEKLPSCADSNANPAPISPGSGSRPGNGGSEGGNGNQGEVPPSAPGRSDGITIPPSPSPSTASSQAPIVAPSSSASAQPSMAAPTPPPANPPPVPQVAPASFKFEAMSTRGKRVANGVLIATQNGQLTFSTRDPQLINKTTSIKVSFEGITCPNTIATIVPNSTVPNILRARVPALRRSTGLSFSFLQGTKVIGQVEIPYRSAAKKPNTSPFNAKEIRAFCAGLERF